MPSSRIVHAFVVSRKHSGEADRFVTFFSQEEGFIRAVAKGVRKIPSSRGGHLEPLTLVTATLTEGKAGVYVGMVETQEYFSSLHEDSDALSRIRSIFGTCIHLFDVGQGVPDLFTAIVEACMALPALSVAKRALVEASLYLRMMQYAGLLPELTACAVCATSKTSEDIVLSSSEGIWHCRTCVSSIRNNSHVLSSRQFSVLRYLAAKPDDAARIAITDEEALAVSNAVQKLLSHATQESLVVYS